MAAEAREALKVGLQSLKLLSASCRAKANEGAGGHFQAMALQTASSSHSYKREGLVDSLASSGIRHPPSRFEFKLHFLRYHQRFLLCWHCAKGFVMEQRLNLLLIIVLLKK